MKIFNKIKLGFLSILLWVHFILSSIILTPFLILLRISTFFFDPQLKILHKFSCFWGAQYIWVNPMWSLKIEHKERFNDRQAHIMVCNHQSLVDIIVVYSLFKHFKWTSKVENFKLPFVGWVLSFNNSIPVYRGAHDAYIKFAARAIKELNAHSSIIMFPEGTRSQTGKLGRFKDGAFKLAHDAKVSILPMVIHGTSAAVPKKGWMIKGKQKLILRVLDPVHYNSYKHITVKETSDMIRNIIHSELEKMK